MFAGPSEAGAGYRPVRWFHFRLREVRPDKDSPFSEIVEVDQTYGGGRQGNKHDDKKVEGWSAVGKAPVLAMRQRGGNLVTMPIKLTDKGSRHDRRNP